MHHLPQSPHQRRAEASQDQRSQSGDHRELRRLPCRCGFKGSVRPDAEGGELCYQCHDAAGLKAGGTMEHAPFKSGNCLSCHNPHSSEYPKLQLKDGNNLCVTCHKEKGEAPRPCRTLPLPRKGTPLLPQASCRRNKGLLVAKGAELCYTCHAKTKEASRRIKTSITRLPRGECSACHNPHGSGVPGMLKDRMDIVCYGCHVDLRRS